MGGPRPCKPLFSIPCRRIANTDLVAVRPVDLVDNVDCLLLLHKDEVGLVPGGGEAVALVDPLPGAAQVVSGLLTGRLYLNSAL